TDQNLGLPSQPDRSLPLNRLLNPGSTSAANAGVREIADTAATRTSPARAFASGRREQNKRIMEHLDVYGSVNGDRSGISLKQSTSTLLRIHPHSGRLLPGRFARSKIPEILMRLTSIAYVCFALLCTPARGDLPKPTGNTIVSPDAKLEKLFTRSAPIKKGL